MNTLSGLFTGTRRVFGICSLLCLLACLSAGCRDGLPPHDPAGAERPLTANDRWVSAASGLRVRTQPSLQGETVHVLSNHTRVVLVAENAERVTIQGVTGRWTKISHAGKEGWVFGGHLLGMRDFFINTAFAWGDTMYSGILQSECWTDLVFLENGTCYLIESSIGAWQTNTGTDYIGYDYHAEDIMRGTFTLQGNKLRIFLRHRLLYEQFYDGEKSGPTSILRQAVGDARAVMREFSFELVEYPIQQHNRKDASKHRIGLRSTGLMEYLKQSPEYRRNCWILTTRELNDSFIDNMTRLFRGKELPLSATE